MAILHSSVCPRCGKAYMGIGLRSAYLGPAVKTCGECAVREAEVALHEARRAAYDAAYARAPSGARTASRRLEDAKLQVLLRLVCKGKTEVEALRKMKRYWDEVRKEVES